MTYYGVYNWNNTTGITSWAGTTYPSRAPEFTLVLVGFVLLNSMCILLSFFFLSLCCMAFFDYSYGIFNLFNNDISSVWIVYIYTRVLIVDHRQFSMDFVCTGNVILEDSSGCTRNSLWCQLVGKMASKHCQKM